MLQCRYSACYTFSMLMLTARNLKPPRRKVCWGIWNYKQKFKVTISYKCTNPPPDWHRGRGINELHPILQLEWNKYMKTCFYQFQIFFSVKIAKFDLEACTWFFRMPLKQGKWNHIRNIKDGRGVIENPKSILDKSEKDEFYCVIERKRIRKKKIIKILHHHTDLKGYRYT